MEVFILYPNQLFKNISNLKNKKVLLVEDSLFFTQYKFHIQKLVLHRASMKFYEDYLSENKIDVEYFEDESYIKKYKNQKIHIYSLHDNYLEKKVYGSFKDIKTHPSLNFINPNDDSKFLHKFYMNRRKELDIFMENGKPLYGKYSFDSENRKKLPKDIKIPTTIVYDNFYIDDAKEYCKKFDSFGECEDFYYPISFVEAKLQLSFFIKEKFEKYGDFQDAISKDKNQKFLFHSNISSSLNIGLLDLEEVIESVINADAPYNSKEGFIRQIIGWREFMLRVYESDGIALRNSNFFSFKNKMPKAIYEKNTKIKIVDDVLEKIENSAYAHHIERLMVLGNFFLLTEIEPNEVYKFFMASFIDSYDWVMLGNVYGMSGFSDGGSITTKPYISSSNYLIKMSDYSKKEPWCEIFDALYWRFLYKYSKLFKDNPRMKMQISLLNRMKKEKLDRHLELAEQYLKELHGNEITKCNEIKSS